MKKILAASLAIVLMSTLAATALADSERDYFTLDKFLATKQLTRADIDLKPIETDRVFNPITERWEDGKKLFEVWRKEIVRPAQKLAYADGTPAMVTDRVFRQIVSKTVQDTVENEADVMVRQEQIKKTTTSTRKRYLTSK